MNDLQVRPDRDIGSPCPIARPRRKSLFREYSEAIIIAVLLALFIRQFAVQAFTIPSGSMMDTLLIGDYILVNKFLFGAEIPLTDRHLPGLRDPRRGDVIVFKYPNDETRDFIKRIIAVGGDTIQVRDNRVLLNGHSIDEPYVRPGSFSGPPSAQCGYAYGCDPLKVPEGSYFVMGDNRDNSQDSRYWGFVKREKIRGKAFLIYWSWNGDGHWLRWRRLGMVPAVRRRWTPRGRRLGVYVHLPFCAERCGYCSFNTAPYTSGAARSLPGRAAAGVRPGRGGAVGGPRHARHPLPRGRHAVAARRPPRWPRVLDAHPGALPRSSPGAEVTVECNPDERDARPASAATGAAGVTRISLGVQSLDDRDPPRGSTGCTLGRPGAPRLRGRARGRLRQHQRGPHLRAARRSTARAGTRTVAGRARLGARPPLRLRPDPRRGQPLARRRRERAARTRTRSPAQYRALARLAARGRLRALRGLQLRAARPPLRATTSSTGARRNTWRWARAPAASSGDVRYGNVKPVERYCALVEAGRCRSRATRC